MDSRNEGRAFFGGHAGHVLEGAVVEESASDSCELLVNHLAAAEDCFCAQEVLRAGGGLKKGAGVSHVRSSSTEKSETEAAAAVAVN